jgi:NAD(P)-dependent dehydrogenase (short-subunit alcohol dehydrogenase family)
VSLNSNTLCQQRGISKVQGKRIIVVGAGSGIGKGIAFAAREAGAEVVLVGRSKEKLDKVVADIPSDANTQVVTADITNEADVVRLYEEAGSFDHLVSTVADLTYQPVREFDLTAARRSVDSKLMSSLLLAKHGCTRARSGGSLTFLSGIAAYRPMPRGAVVAAINGALASLAYALALELAPLRVNVVSPGWVDTPIWDTVAGDKKYDMQAQMANRLPVGRIGRPEDIAQAVLSIMVNGYMTGTVVHVDGGQRLV